MKNIIFTFCFFLICGLSQAQLKVITNGDVGVGESNPIEKLHVGGNIAMDSPETGGTTVQNRNHLIYGVGGAKRLQFSTDISSSLSFAWINMFGDETCADCEPAKKGNLSMAGKQIFLRSNNNSGGFGQVAVEIDDQQDMYVTGDIYSMGNLVSSDKRLKRDIIDFSLGLKEVLKMNPKKYYYNGQGGVGSTRRPHVGVIAQEFQEIASDAVVEYNYSDPYKDISENYLAVDEGSIKFMLVNAIKEQHQMIVDRDNKIDELERQVNEIKELLKSVAINEDGEIIHGTEVTLTEYDLASLEQNNPNPFNGFTTIDYVIPTSAKNAKINIYNLNGKLMKVVNIDHSGKGNLKVNAVDIPAGIYVYDLEVEGKVIDTKKMALQK